MQGETALSPHLSFCNTPPRENLLFRRRTERRSARGEPDEGDPRAAARRRIRRLWGPPDGAGRLPVACRPDGAGRDVAAARAVESAQVPGLGPPGRSLFPPRTAGRRGAGRLSGFQLVDRAPGEGAWRSGVLLRAAADLGLGQLASEKDATVRRPRAVQPALRGAVVSRARLQRNIRRPSLLRRSSAPAARSGFP